jgi:hypothetical protein
MTDQDIDPREHRLRLVERQIADAERHITLHRYVLARLEQSDLSASETAKLARENLRRTQNDLQRYSAERRRIQAQCVGN